MFGHDYTLLYLVIDMELKLIYTSKPLNLEIIKKFMERWLSGLKRSPAKRVSFYGARVRIPLSPPEFEIMRP